MIVDYKPEQYFSLTPNQPAVIIHNRFSRNEHAAYSCPQRKFHALQESVKQTQL